MDKARLGGLRRVALYGNPGTPEGRSRGGKKTISLFHKNPDFARSSGFVIRKQIKYPVRSSGLAEFIGILLGDGGVPGTHQLTISFNDKTDNAYAGYIGGILKSLFSLDYHIHHRKNSDGADIVVNSSNLTDFLIKNGVVKGNKVKNQVDVPPWINTRLEYQISCLRGLMDTDGGLYLHKYNVNRKGYEYLKLSFANRSKPLLNFTFSVLRKLNYEASLDRYSVSIYSLAGVKRYMLEIGTHNPKHLRKFKAYFVN
jgi:intein/homing endonuclease